MGLYISNINVNDNETFINQAPFSFDLSVMDLYLSLASGSTLLSLDKSMIANFKELFLNLSKSKISIWVSTPSFAEMCLADSSFNNNILPNLKLMLFCGETLVNSCASKLHKRFPGIRIINTYGPTEANVAITAIDIDEEMSNMESALPVGYVKEDCNIFIVNNEGNEVPDGEKGEIVIAGSSVSIGYFNNELATKKAFSTVKINGGFQ